MLSLAEIARRDVEMVYGDIIFNLVFSVLVDPSIITFSKVFKFLEFAQLILAPPNLSQRDAFNFHCGILHNTHSFQLYLIT